MKHLEKLLYVTFVDYKERAFLGVIKKIEYQLRAFRKAGMETVLVGQYGNDAVIIEEDGSQRIVPAEGRPRRAVIADTTEKVISERQTDYAYIRFQFFCNNVALMTSRMKKHGMKVIMEIPTYPYEGELKLQGLKGIPKLLCDKAFRGLCCRNIDRLAVSGPEKEVMGVPAFTMRNGLCMEDIPISKFSYSKDRLDILSVSSMMPWHGVDRALRGVAQYYADGGERDIVLHIVGNGKCKDEYVTLAEELDIGKHVVFYGALFGEELSRMYDRCQLGLGSLCMHRIENLKECSPLKAVEYAAHGMPVITEMKIWFADETEPLSMLVPWDDSPVDFFRVTEFADGMLAGDFEGAKRRIRAVAEKKCDISVSMSPAVEFFRS